MCIKVAGTVVLSVRADGELQLHTQDRGLLSEATALLVETAAKSGAQALLFADLADALTRATLTPGFLDSVAVPGGVRA